MSVSSSATRDARVIFTSGDRSVSERDVIDWALLKGLVEVPWKESQRAAACERVVEERGLEVDSSAVDAASISFRYAHDLITGEETEKWLEGRILTLADFSGFFSRQQSAKTVTAEAPETAFVHSAPEERERFAADLILSGTFDQWAEAYARRIAALAAQETSEAKPEEGTALLEKANLDEEKLTHLLGEIGRDQAWFDQIAAAEAAYLRQRATLVSEKDLARELVSLRLLLTCFELETVQVDSRDAASEVIACVKNDGMQMAEVAEEGRYPYYTETLLLEDLAPEQQQRFLSARAGAILDPLAREHSFEVTGVRQRTDPTLEDAGIRRRIEERLVARHFDSLVSKHISWRLLPPSNKA